ncbi:MAG: hypothetical protein JXX29_12370 [Deltaproteobacteria bacterium]|nr:hypothetical protein [Deltaproteobacteria bacterium]MBN2672469.1 hypothetical protein [Deltaproteobacteria bacterium]
MQKKYLIQIILFMLGAVFCTGALAQETASAESEDAAASATLGAEIEAASVAPVAENTLAACQDQADNDNDGFVDCADQDCSIYAICAAAKDSALSTAPAVAPEPEDTVTIFERGRMCKDGIDNDEDGLADCHDPKCKPTNYCQREMYEYPSDPYKPMGPFFQFGLGLALPNFNWKDNRVDSEFGQNIPFDPDMGGILSFKFGVAPIPWLGFGVNMNAGGTFGTNRADFFSLADLDNEYKYDGYKVFGHIGGFVRLQYPVRRFNMYMDIAGGYSFARYKWRVYDGDESWSDISGDWEDDDWEDDTDVDHETKYKQGHHFSLVLEPGFDYFFVDRKLAAGLRAWLPVVSSDNKGMDNIGIMFNITFTPTWREPKRLKDEYK